MAVFIGNCQAMVVRDALTSLTGREEQWMRFYTPLLPEVMDVRSVKASVAETIPADLLPWLTRVRAFGYQPSVNDLRMREPGHFVLSMFDEADSFRHRKHGYVVCCYGIGATDANREVSDWFAREFEPLEQSIETYFERFLTFLKALRRHFPAAPILLMARLPHYPVLSGRVASSLQKWEFIQHGLPAFLARVRTEVDNAQTLELARLAGAEFAKSKTLASLSQHFYLSDDTTAHGTVYRLHMDLEHLSDTVNLRAARHVRDFIENGDTVHHAEETVPESWSTPDPTGLLPLSRAELLTRINPDSIRTLFDSHDGFDHARAVTELALSGGEHTELLLERAETLFIDLNVLAALEVFATLHPEKSMLGLVEHLRKRIPEGAAKLSTFYSECVLRLDALAELLRRKLTGDKTGLLKGLGQFVIWGAGGAGREALEFFRNHGLGTSMLGFVDSNPDLHGKRINDANVFAPNALPADVATIAIASAFENEIRRYLLATGLGKGLTVMSARKLMRDAHRLTGNVHLEFWEEA